MPEPKPKPKPRRSIFDTLKKSVNGRLGLAEAASLADKISFFPVRHATEEAAGVFAPSDQLSDQQSDHIQTHPSDHLSGQMPGHLSAHEPTQDPVVAPTGRKAGDNDSTHEPTSEPTHAPTHEPIGRRDDALDIRRIIRALPENKRRFLHFVIDNEPVGDDYILSRHAVARALHFTEISVKRYFAEFAALGFFHKETYRRGVCQGLRLFLSRARCQAFKQFDPTPDPTKGPTFDSTYAPTGEKDAYCGPMPDPTRAPTSYKEERKKESFSLSSERMAMTWPNLHRAGFGPEQIRQIAAALAELGKAADKVVQGLDHAEWELAGGGMRDKNGQPVADPCAWVFASLARTGYYRRPKGYISPEEQAVRDVEEEARAVAVARQKAEQARFETWRDGLSPEELDKAMHGHPGGPRDAWLKSVWRKSNRADAERIQP